MTMNAALQASLLFVDQGRHLLNLDQRPMIQCHMKKNGHWLRLWDVTVSRNSPPTLSWLERGHASGYCLLRCLLGFVD